MHLARDAFGAAPGAQIDPPPADGAVAGGGELAGAAVALIDHGADRLGISPVARAVHDHLGHRRLAFLALVAGLVKDGLGQAFDVVVGNARRGDQVQARGDVLDLIVSVVTGRDAIIGQVLYFTKQAALTLHRS